MAYTVYKHTTPNGKVYIGITCRPLEVRWKKDGSGYKTQAFYRAIKKYGWKNIKHDIIAENLTVDEANQMEIDLIKKYDSTNPDFGYNITTGGEGCCGFHLSEETRKKLSQINKGKKHTPEEIEKMRKNCTGWKQTEEAKAKISKGLKGKPKSEEHKEKLRLANLGKKTSPETKAKLSAAHKGKKLTDNQKLAISLRTKGKHLSEETKDKIKKNSKSKKKVICVENGMVFDTVKDASSWLGMTPNAVSNAVCGYVERAGGYHWKYYEEGNKHDHSSANYP